MDLSSQHSHNFARAALTRSLTSIVIMQLNVIRAVRWNYAILFEFFTMQIIDVILTDAHKFVLKFSSR